MSEIEIKSIELKADHVFKLFPNPVLSNMVLVDLGNLVDVAANGQVSVHSQCSSWGGDMVAGTDGLLYLITHRKYVFSIDPSSRMTTYMGVIKGLPESFNVNGAAVDQEGRVLMSCSFGNQLYYHLDLETLTAQPAYKEDTKRFVDIFNPIEHF